MMSIWQGREEVGKGDVVELIVEKGEEEDESEAITHTRQHWYVIFLIVVALSHFIEFFCYIYIYWLIQMTRSVADKDYKNSKI